MSSKKLINKYVPPFTEHLSGPWFECDGIMSYIDALKCEEFLNNTQDHFEKAEVINFNIIHHKCRDDLLKKDLKTYRIYIKVWEKKILLVTIKSKGKTLFLVQYLPPVKMPMLKKK